jgi:hypothetical protein
MVEEYNLIHVFNNRRQDQKNNRRQDQKNNRRQDQKNNRRQDACATRVIVIVIVRLFVSNCLLIYP